MNKFEDISYRDICRLAQNLARNCGYAMFPCSVRKTPTRPKAEGGSGYKDATKDPGEIAWLWKNWPGPLIGIATGEISVLAVLDLDVKHDSARAWFQTYGERLPQTRCQRSRSGGVHFYFRYIPGIDSNNGRDGLLGVDVKADRGCVIHWFAAGLPCLDHSPPACWPDWLTEAALPRKTRPLAQRHYNRGGNANAAIAGLLKTICQSAEGDRNATLNWAACHIGGHARSCRISRGEAETLLAEAALAAGLPKIEADRAIASGLKGAGA